MELVCVLPEKYGHYFHVVVCTVFKQINIHTMWKRITLVQVNLVKLIQILNIDLFKLDSYTSTYVPYTFIDLT